MHYGTGFSPPGTMKDMGGGRYGGTTPSSQSSLNAARDDTSQRGSIKAEKELESERIWWAEASERQVHELESTFQAEFNRACQALRAELGASKDRLEMKVEDERLATQEKISELRRMIDSLAATVAEVGRKADMAQIRRDVAPAAAPDLRHEFDALQAAQRRAEQETAALLTGVKTRVDAIQADMSHLRGDTVPLLRSELDAMQVAKVRTDQETATSLEAVKSRVDSIQASVTGVYRDRVGTEEVLRLEQETSSSLEALRSRVDSVQESTSLLDAMKSRVEAVQADMARLRGETIPALRSEFRSEFDTKQVTRLRADQETTTILAAMQSRMDSIQEASSSLDAIKTRVDTIQGDMASLRGDTVPLLRSELDAMQASKQRADQDTKTMLDGLKTRLDSVQDAAASLDTMKSRVDAIQADMAHLRGDTVPLLRSELDAMQAGKLRTDQDVTCLLDNLKSRVDSLQATTASLDAMKARMDSIQASVADVCRERVGSEATQRAEEANMAHLHGDIVPLVRSELDAMQAAKLRTDQEITAALDALKRRVDTIQEASESLEGMKSRMDAVQADMAHLRGDTVPLLRSELDAMQAMKLRTDQEATTAVESLRVRLVESIQETSTSLDSMKARMDSFQASLTDVCNVCLGSSEVQRLEEQARRNSQEPIGRQVVAPPDAAVAIAPPTPSLLSPDLKSSIEGLVQRVNHTLTRQRDSVPSPAVGGAPPLQPATPVAAAAVAPQSPTRYLNALQEVKELRERNLSLRERNAELVEELLTHDGMLPGEGVEAAPLPVLDQSYPSSTPSGTSVTLPSFTGIQPARLNPGAAQPGSLFGDRASAAMRLSNTSTPGGVRSPTLGRASHGPSATPQLHPGMSGCAAGAKAGIPLRQPSTARGTSPTGARLGQQRVGAPPTAFQR